jgi:restriction endonuclease Mrr
LRDVLVQTNTGRASDGRPPVFEETKPNFWTLATASGSSLAQSYEALEKWQASHRNALASTIVGRLQKMDSNALGTVVTLLLDRLGYQGLVRGEDGTTIGATAPRGLTRTTVAVRTFDSNAAVDGDQVAALRGSLHQFSAAEGVIIAFGDVTDAARAQVAVANVAPVTILDAADVAGHMIASGVGVARFSVDVSCLDEAVFREFRKA